MKSLISCVFCIILLPITFLFSACNSTPETVVATNIPIPVTTSTMHPLVHPNQTLTATLAIVKPTAVKLSTPPDLMPTPIDPEWLKLVNLAYYDQELKLAQADGSKVIKLSSGSMRWSWSPDGNMLAYGDSDGNIQILNMNTGQIVQVYPQGIFTWHPKSRHLVVANNNYLFLINADDGQEIAQLTDVQWKAETNMLSFAPDGKRLAFGNYYGLYIIEMLHDNANQPIGFGTFIDISITARQAYIDNIIRVQWSPMGDRLAVTSSKWQEQPQIYIISPEGNLRAQIKIAGGWAQEIAWSPDGAYLAMEGYNENLDARIYISNNLGGSLIELEKGFVGCLNWVPGSSKAIYSRNQAVFGGGHQLLILSDIAGIQKEVIPISNIIESETIFVCAQARPNHTFSLVPIQIPTATPICGQTTRLQVGEKAVLLPGEPNLVRSAPQKGDNVIGKLYPGVVVKIIDGPACADGLVFWKVENEAIPGSIGWTAEGNGLEYWLEPLK